MTNITPLSDFVSNQIGADRQYSSNVDLARATGLSEGTIRRLRAGEEPSLSTLRKLANGLHYPIEELQRMAGILEDDQQVQDDLNNFITSGIKRLSPKDKKTIWALVKTLLKEQEEEDADTP